VQRHGSTDFVTLFTVMKLQGVKEEFQGIAVESQQEDIVVASSPIKLQESINIPEDEELDEDQVFKRIATSRDMIDSIDDPRSDPQVVHFADSFYQSAAYWFLIRPSSRGWVYMFVLIVMLFLQICALFGYLSSVVAANYHNIIEKLIGSTLDQLATIGLYRDWNSDNVDGSSDSLGTYVASIIATLIPDDVNPDLSDIDETGWDDITLVFVAAVVSLNILAEVEESYISRKLVRYAVAIEGFHPHQNWVFKFKYFLFLLINYIRRYVLTFLVVGVTAVVMNNQTAESLILNGLAVYIILEVDNVMYRTLNTEKSLLEIEKHALVEMSESRSWYLKMRNMGFAVASFLAMTIGGSMSVTDVPDASITMTVESDSSFDSSSTLSLGYQTFDDYLELVITTIIILACSYFIFFLGCESVYHYYYRDRLVWKKEDKRVVWMMITIAIPAVCIYLVFVKS
jgi:hypothetical protein